MAHLYDPDRSITIPRDGRFVVAALWMFSLALIIGDSADLDASFVSVWGLLLGMAATCWSALMMHCHSRRVILEVMSWEHRQLLGEKECGCSRSTLEVDRGSALRRGSTPTRLRAARDITHVPDLTPAPS